MTRDRAILEAMQEAMMVRNGALMADTDAFEKALAARGYRVTPRDHRSPTLHSGEKADA